MKSNMYILKGTLVWCLLVLTTCFFFSCEKAFEYDLPDSNSKQDTILPMADFSYIPDGSDFTKILFTDLSFESAAYLWDFGGGDTSTEQDPSYSFPGEGTYPVTLTVSDANGASDALTIDVEVIDAFVAIQPDVLNGDFELGNDDWSFANFTGGTTSPFNESGDGSPLLYDGSDSGLNKTDGAKWTMSSSAGDYTSANTRYAYQAIVVSPNTDYVLEYEYAIKDDGTQAPGDNRIVGAILNGHFEDGADGVTSFNEGPLLSHVGDVDLGKGNFTLVEQTFTSNESGEISIFIFGVTDVDAYVDNVKVYPAD